MSPRRLVAIGVSLAVVAAAGVASGQKVYYLFRTQPGPTDQGVVITDTSAAPSAMRFVPRASATAYSPMVAGDDAVVAFWPETRGAVMALHSATAKGLKIWPSGGVSIGGATDPGNAGWLRALMLVGPSLPTETVVSTAGTLNDVALGGAGLLTYAGTGATITGIAGGAPGQLVWVQNHGTGTLRLAHADTNSAAANRMQFLSVRGQFLGIGGSVVLWHSGDPAGPWTTLAIDPGNPIDVPFNAGSFWSCITPNSSWTVDLADMRTFRYWQNGNTLHLDLALSATSTAGLPTALCVWLPDGFESPALVTAPVRIGPNGTDEAGGFLRTNDGGSPALVIIRRLGSAAWPDSTNTTFIEGQIDLVVS